ncbi:hypothetical protein ABH925_007136 [Streptacidiphilus sp. EB129]
MVRLGFRPYRYWSPLQNERVNFYQEFVCRVCPACPDRPFRYRSVLSIGCPSVF